MKERRRSKVPIRALLMEALDRNYKQTEIAKAIGCSPGSITLWKNRDDSAMPKYVRRLRKFLDEDRYGKERVFFEEATLKDIAKRARELGFEVTFKVIE